MKRTITSTIALLMTVGVASAQSAGSGTGALCSDLNGLDPAAQTAYLQGYQAGMGDAGMSAGASTNAATASAQTGTAKAAGATSATGDASSMAAADLTSIITQCAADPAGTISSFMSAGSVTAQ